MRGSNTEQVLNNGIFFHRYKFTNTEQLGDVSLITGRGEQKSGGYTFFPEPKGVADFSLSKRVIVFYIEAWLNINSKLSFERAKS